MRIEAGIIGAVVGLALTAHAYTSPYSSMAVAGSAFSNAWDVTPNMVLAANNTWIGTQTLSAASGEFKFAANGTWTTNWGGNASLFRVPATASAPTLGGGNLKFAGLSNGIYRFMFDDVTARFQMEWAGPAPLPLPSITNWALVGDFNGWVAGSGSRLTNSPANTNIWSRAIDFEVDSSFQFQPDGDVGNQWGAPEATALSIVATNVPVTNSACGKSSFTLAGVVPGTFLFALDSSNATFTVTQIATQTITVSTMTVQGNFIATSTPPANMTRRTDVLWESDHQITNNGVVTLRFSANTGARRWGATNTVTNTLPASGTMATGLTGFANVSGVSTGRYRVTFNHQTGAFTFRRLYAETDGINLLKNSGFEQTTLPDGGDAVDWGGYQAWPKRVVDGFAPHSGNWCGAIYGQLFGNWQDYGSFAQDVLVSSGRTYRASAWFKATPDWTASTMQIKIEWRDATNGALADPPLVEIDSLTNHWVKYSVEGTAPTNATQAHVVFLCSGAGSNGTLHVDDAEMRLVAERTQNFDTWGSLASFGAFSPDWSISSGKTIYNVPPGRPPADVFISQYVEGTGNNKAVEIFNGTLATLDLTAQNYVLQQYDNGATNPTVSLALSGSIASGATLVIGRPGAPTNYAPDLAIGGLPNLQTNRHLTFNGDDAIVLRQGGTNGTVKDRVGQVGTNATGSIWSRNTKNHTLTRKSTIFTGTVNAVTSAFPLLDEWELSASDSFADLGTHEISFLDPNEPYTPAGYSLIMNTNATLTSGELDGGIGDVSFWFRTESMSPAVTLVIETAEVEEGPWTNAFTLSGVARSNFTYYVVAINRGDHAFVRFRQTDGGTNRFRIDEIAVSDYSAERRVEDFSGWTEAFYEVPGSYSRNGWSLQDAMIAPTSGLFASRAALLSPPSSSIVSPAYAGGVGETLFWTRADDPAVPAYLLLQTSLDGTNWTTQGSFTASTGNTYTAWLYVTNAGAQMRLKFDPAKSSGDARVDNIEVRVPALYRNQDFDGWPYKSNYTNGISQNQGWSISNCLVDAQYSYAGMAARLNSAVTGSALIQSPYLPDGIGSITYRLRKANASDTAPAIQVQLSANGVGWTNILATNSASSTNYEQFAIFREDTTNHFVRFVHTAGAAAAPIDDIRIGNPQPRPQVAIAPGVDPAAPGTNDTVQIVADVVSSYGASILSVTGFYQIASGSWTSVTMSAIAYGSYASISSVPAQRAGTNVNYYVQVRYAGIGAAPAFAGYSTNLATSATNSYKASSVRQGDVWINEISYTKINEDFLVLEEDSEFIELCGVAGNSISNWTVQLAFGADADIAANSNQAVYASYKITAGHTFTNQTNGFSFFVLGDQQLLDIGKPVNKVLTTYVPTNVAHYAVSDRDHIYNNRGVIRLLNEYSNLVYSLSYEGFAAGSDPVPVNQNLWATNSIALAGTGSAYSDFAWANPSNLTVGAINAGQTLVPQGDVVLAQVWHIPTRLIVPLSTNTFYMRDPLAAQSFDPLGLYFGYSTTNYTFPDGTLYYRTNGGTSWNTLSMTIRAGSVDSNGDACVYATIPARTFPRGTSIDYVLQANPNKSGIVTAYLGADPTNVYARYESLAEAQASPFTYAYAVRSDLVITNFATNATSWLFYTEGNDPLEPFTKFKVKATTNLLATTNTWFTNSFTNSPADAFGQNVFVVTKTNLAPKLFYRVDPIWP